MKKVLLTTVASISLLMATNFYKIDDYEVKKGIAYQKTTHLKLDGVVQEFYETGELSSEKSFKFGIPTDMKTYKISGALSSQVVFKNGKAVGGKIYYENVKKDRAMTHADFMRYKLEY
jgi:antitoxin component YwqK of YwqJK toxin-antitoxin module